MDPLHQTYHDSTTALIPGQGEGGNPLARRAAGETTAAPRLLLFSSRGGVMLSDLHECPQGPLLPLGLQAPSFPHWTTHS